MSAIEETLRANGKYADQFNLAGLEARSARKLAVLACMDARLDLYEILGLEPGDAHIIRNAGGIVTEDALRSLIISHHLLGVKEIMLVHHTDCGMMSFKNGELRARLEKESGVAAVESSEFHAFTDLHQDTLRQMQKITSHPWLPDSLVVRGFIYDVTSGRLGEVHP